MAHAYIASVEEELSCCVCFELFVDPHIPKQLDCPHVICTVCIGNIIKGGRTTIACPECRLVTAIPKEGVVTMKTNLSLRNLAEKHQKYMHVQKNQQPTTNGDKEKKVGIPSCSEHGEKLNTFCVTCNINVCHTCVLLSHNVPEHEVINLKVIYRQQMMELDITLGQLEADAKRCEKLSEETHEMERKILSSISFEEHKIDQAAARGIDNVIAECTALKAQLREITSSKLIECHQQRATMRKKACDLRGVIANAEKDRDVISHHDYICQHRTITEQLHARREPSQVGGLQDKADEVTFKETLMIKLGTIQQKESNVVKKRNATKGELQKLELCSESKNLSFEGDKVVSSRASNIITVSDSGTNKVHIYYKQLNGRYTKMSSLHVPGNEMINCSIAVGSDDRCLVSKSHYIRFYSAIGQYEKSIYPKLEGVSRKRVKMSCITTTPAGRIIAGYLERRLLTLHKSDGDQVKSISIKTHSPPCMTSIGNSQVAIADNNHDKVYVLDVESKEDICRIDSPGIWSICYDSETDSLLVGRQDYFQAVERLRGGVIEQYCVTTGKLLACIAEDLDDPTDMTITNEGKLLVADMHTFKLFKMSTKK